MENIVNLNNRSMTSVTENLSKIKIKKNQSFNSGDGRGTSDVKSSKLTKKTDYKAGNDERSKMRYLKWIVHGHVVVGCKRPELVIEENVYPEPEVKIKTLVKKQKLNKAYIIEGKCWDDTDDDMENKLSNLALMEKIDNVAESSRLKKVQTLTQS